MQKQWPVLEDTFMKSNYGIMDYAGFSSQIQTQLLFIYKMY